jgi:subtilisin family serine protease
MLPRAQPFSVALLLLLFSLTPSPRTAPVHVDLAGAIETEVLLHVREPLLRLSVPALERRFGAEVRSVSPEIGVIRLELPAGEPLPAAIARLQALPGVELAEPNHRLYPLFTPNDPLFGTQLPYLSVVQAPQAWDLQRGQPAVLVAVLDSGLDFDHEDLEGKAWTNVLETPGNGVDDDGNGCVDDLRGCSFMTPENSDPSCQTEPASVVDDNGHGTFISGIIAATNNNQRGMSGIAPGVTILPVKILDCRGGGNAADAAAGILYAAKAGARVANISFGADGESQTLARAIRTAFNQYGMVIVAATGNEGTGRVTYPARLPETLAVASSGTPTDSRARSFFSNWGPEVSVAAPGINIVSAVPQRFCGVTWLCVEGQPYAVASGTSFAAPQVAGLAALLVSHHPNLSGVSIMRIIRETADPLPDGDTPNWDGAGRIRMRAALDVPRYFLGAPAVARE